MSNITEVDKRPRLDTGKLQRQLKITVDANLIAEFKASCEAADASMAAVLSDAMATYVKKRVTKRPPRDYTTRRQRKAALAAMANELNAVLANEEQYRDNFPESLIGSKNYELAETLIALLDEVITALAEVE